MAACGGLEHIFDKPLPEKPTSLLESFSPWHQIKSMKPINDSSFTELFGELHFKESNDNVVYPPSASSSSSYSNMHDSGSVVEPSYCQTKQYRPQGDSFLSESLSLCTEGLGFESSDDVDDLLKNDEVCNDQWHRQDERRNSTGVENIGSTHCSDSSKSSKMSRGAGDFPPPISCIGRSGKPWVCFKSYREGGRFILKEIRFPTQEFLHAFRENGRLRLQFIQSDDDDDDEILDEVQKDDVHEEDVLGNGGGIDEGDDVGNKGS